MEDKSKPSFTGRLITDTRIQEFAQPFGYPIRVCRWEMVDDEKIVPDSIGKQITCKNCLRHSTYKRD